MAASSLKIGFMVSLRDYKSLSVPGADFSELLLFEGDFRSTGPMAMIEVLCAVRSPIQFVHTQEFVGFEGREELVDLSADDEALRTLSVDVVRRTRDLATVLGGVAVVIHPGGIRPELGDHGPLLRRLEQSLDELGPAMLLLENMPWYYWLRKDQRMVSNLCVTMEDFDVLSDKVEGFTLDTCHGYLSRPEGDHGFCPEFMERFGPRVKHVHASDATAPDTEGLQIGEGEFDFSFLKGIRVPVLVEIWKGHEDDGAGFKLGVERLRKLEQSW